MKILFAAGGTAGHINPAIAVASYIREIMPETEILFVGTKDHMEARLVPNAGFDFKTIDISGFRRSFSPSAIAHNVKTVARLIKSEGESKKIIREFKPDVCVGFGGYVSGPVLEEAVRLGIPTCIHEQNAYPGITNKTLAKKVDRVMVTVEDAQNHLEVKNEITVTGLPVRGEIIKADKDFHVLSLALIKTSRSYFPSAVPSVPNRLTRLCLIFLLKMLKMKNIIIFILSAQTAVSILKSLKKQAFKMAERAVLK